MCDTQKLLQVSGIRVLEYCWILLDIICKIRIITYWGVHAIVFSNRDEGLEMKGEGLGFRV